ncbi:type ISP restriction/modification enzyme [Candidatus Spongiihabitans sp.]|uniref:type ISP restriction/modification enzyme n=1 Tax=Candidatus Spongiihabitans sp. TaxID=3101308 RepID=UPI003C7C6DF5
MHWIATYTHNIATIAAGGDATEFSYRTDIENMLKAATAEFGVAADILQEPSRIKNSGAPDFRISAKGGGVIGYVECKNPGENLSKLLGKAQLEKYRALSDNILLTDSWRWYWLRDGKKIEDATLTEKPNTKTKTDFVNLLRAFMEVEAEKIGDAKRLASALARRCALLREGLEAHGNDDPSKSSLHGLLKAFQTALDTELSFDKFADAFAQTLVYSLLLAKLKAPAGDKLDLYNINKYIPANFAVIREITVFLQGLHDSEYEHIRWVVDDILAAVNNMDAAAVSETMSYRNGGKGFDDSDDPYIYFYENFLAAYDAKLRERRGVYYTPPPVVKFIVRAVDDLLRRDFGLSGGIAETNAVTALDFAAGTGTFMLEMIRKVLSDTPPARRDMLTRGHILKNFYGFELLMAPYAIAHLKLSQFLADNGVPLKHDERINVFLTNTLERIGKQVELPMMPKLAEEVNRAQKIKDAPVLVITGNPPYSVASQNKGEWIIDLINSYKQINGEKLKEQNLKVLLDDYVKFFRFAQWKMENVERGIVAIITNHGFLDNPTFRGMRKSLLDTFDALYFLDLHGNANKKETAPDGGKDENVFDIRQGVAISILVKNPNAKQKGVFHADFYGKRDEKYKDCLENDIATTPWKQVTPTAPFYLFIPRDNKAAKKYEKFYSVKDIFITQSTGIKSHRDHFAFAFDADEIKPRINHLIDKKISTESLREKYNLKDTGDWSLESARTALRYEHSFNQFLKPCLYRPFDTRWCYYGKETMERPRPEVMRHMLAGRNVALSVSRSATGQSSWQDAFVVDKIAEFGIMSTRPGNSAPIFPLYRYDTAVGQTTRNENLNPEFRRWIDDRYAIAHSPEDILGCIYAILHSPDYRKRYADFLRSDFPRIPFPDDNDEFKRLADIGGELIKAHLLRDHCAGDLAQHAGTGTSHKVEKIRYDETAERLYFNQDEYFAPIPPQVFNFQIGGYQPLDKYLKSRKDRTLTLPETETIQKTANAIAFTIEKMREIDQ